MLCSNAKASTLNWIKVAESGYPWEREALEFVRTKFPSHEPYRAWSNFEFVADDGSINEVDLLVFTPEGFFLIEIKSRPGRLYGDAGTWLWETDGKVVHHRQPLDRREYQVQEAPRSASATKGLQEQGPGSVHRAARFLLGP